MQMTTTTSKRPARNDDVLDAFMKVAGRYPLLTREKEHQLAIAYREHGDKGARELLVNSNLRFVVKVASEYRSYRLDMADVVQEGCIGLVSAVDRFDPHQGNRLLSYAVWRIRSQLQEYVCKHWALVRVLPTSQQRKLLFGRHHGKNDGSPARVNRTDLANWHDKANRARFWTGFDAPVGDGRMTVGETLATTARDAESTVIRLEQHRRVEERVAAVREELTDQQRAVLDRRVMAQDPQTLRELGAELGISCERVRQVELLVKRRLARKLRSVAHAA